MSEIVGPTCSNCGPRVTPLNLGIVALTAYAGSQMNEGNIALAGILGAGLYELGKRAERCPVRAAGTGLMAGAVVAAFVHCISEDRREGHLKW